MDYTRRDLALAYLNAHPVHSCGPTDPDSYYVRLKTYREELLRGLCRLFEFSLDDEMWLKFFLHGVTRSYRGNTHPFAGMLEGGLLLERVKGSGAMEIAAELQEMHEKAAERHLDLTEKILALAKPDNGEVVTSEQLRAIGVNDVEPRDPDFG
ncbi:hypothetical protein ACFWNN_30850 [Lentzea sp. NPDC058450]|uniref:hypothetical protein n=1 Tax=Lentzea sp. NPDC058450 TaxID=3346505 RepID=UPI003647C0F5